MSILDAPEFKKQFEKTTLYATAALEVQKMGVSRKKWKEAKGALQTEITAQDYVAQIDRSRPHLKKWESNLDAAMKAVVVAKKLFKLIGEEETAATKSAEKAAAERKKEADDTKKAAGVSSQLGLMRVAIADTIEPRLVKLETFASSFENSAAAVKAGTIDSKSLFELDEKGKKLEGALGVVNDVKKQQQDLAKLAGPQNSGTLSTAEKDEIKKTLGDIAKLVKRATDVKAKFDQAMLAIKAARKKLYDESAGWLDLAGRAVKGLGDIEKQVSKIDNLLDSTAQRAAKIKTHPNPQTTAVKPNVGLAKLEAIEDDTRWSKTAAGTLKTDVENFAALVTQFDGRQKKLLAAPGYATMAKGDANVAAKGSELADAAKKLQAQLTAIQGRFPKVAMEVKDASQYADKILPFYQDFANAQKLKT